ncbi:MAG: hypothetical protein WDM76_06665 [Limisphaerales bacterium]
MLATGSVLADSYWQGGISDFNVAGSWNPSGVPSGVNAINDSGSNNAVLIRLGDPVWSPWDIRAGGRCQCIRFVYADWLDQHCQRLVPSGRQRQFDRLLHVEQRRGRCIVYRRTWARQAPGF